MLRLDSTKSVGGLEILHGDFNLLLTVTSAAEKHFVLQVNYDDIIDAGRVTIPRQQVDYGGVSGGPVFLSDSGGNQLVGIVSQASDTLPLWRIASLAQVPADIDRHPSQSV